MDVRETYKRLFRFALSLLNVFIFTGIFAVFWFNYYHERRVIGALYVKWGHWAILTLYAVLIYFFAKVYGALKVGFLRVWDVLYSQMLTILFVNSITYVQLALIGHWRFGQHLAPLLWMTGYDIIGACLWVFFARWLYATVYPPKELLLIYGERSPKGILDKFSTRKDKYEIRETVHVEEHNDQYIKERITHFQAVVIGDIPAEQRNNYLKYCYERNIRCYSVPKISDIMMMSSETINLFDTALQLFRNQGLSAEQRLLKRIMDVVVSGLMLIIAFPFMIIIAAMIKLYDHGPVLYRQERLTKDGEIYYIYKFRSMVVDSETMGARLCAKGDNRVTPVGRVIRNLHLDELPQLLNILRGEMSLVGPRPERPEIAAQYKKVIPEFDYRLKVKAGLTGYAQVYGKYNTTPYDKLKLDLFYIENYSIWMDIKLCLLTFKILFQKENTEGVDPSQKTAADKITSEKNTL